MRVAIVQFGDYREAFLRFRSGGGETYYAQRYSVDFVEDLSKRADFVGVCAMLGEQAYDEPLSPKLHSACVPLLAGGRLGERAVIDQIDRWKPSHLILQTPAREVLAWAIERGIDVLPIFADSWRNNHLKDRIHGFLLARLLNRDRISVVANHNLPACRSLARIGVDPKKIVAWDWPHALTPGDYPAKSVKSPPRLLFVGQLTEAKGAGDCIEAAAALRSAGVDFRLSLIGAGAFEKAARDLIAERRLEGLVEIVGRLPHSDVVAQMREAAIVLAPTHHAYPEGMPMTIYEALATRTPLVVSDHPMFMPVLAGAAPVKIVPERDPARLAQAVTEFLAAPSAYRRASEETADLWRRLKGELVWGELIDIWLADPSAAREILRERTLAAVEGRRP